MVAVVGWLLAFSKPAHSDFQVDTTLVNQAYPFSTADVLYKSTGILDLITYDASQLQNQHGGQCVIFARNFLHIPWSDFHGFAGHIKPNSQTPQVGAVVLTHTHAAVIIAIDGTDLTLAESNYHYTERITIGRHMSSLDKNIRGYFIPNILYY